MDRPPRPPVHPPHPRARIVRNAPARGKKRVDRTRPSARTAAPHPRAAILSANMSRLLALLAAAFMFGNFAIPWAVAQELPLWYVVAVIGGGVLARTIT